MNDGWLAYNLPICSFSGHGINHHASNRSGAEQVATCKPPDQENNPGDLQQERMNMHYIYSQQPLAVEYG